MKRFFSLGTALVFYTTAAFAQYTNVLQDGMDQTVNSAWTNDSVWVGQTSSSNTMTVIPGGAVSSTNVYIGTSSNAHDNAISVAGGRWDIADTLTIGPGTNNSVDVNNGGRLSVGDLDLQAGNNFNLNSGGFFAISTNLDVSTDGFNWNDGGHLSVGGDLTGVAVSNNSVVLDGGRDLTLDGGLWNTGATNLTVGSGTGGSDLMVSNSAWVYVGEATNNDVMAGSDGGILVASTNGASMLVGHGSTVETTGSLYIGGTNAALTGSVAITNGSSVEAQSLEIGNAGSSLDVEAGGTLVIRGDFDADQGGFNWENGGALSVGGALTKSNGLDGTEQMLTVDGSGASWNVGGDLSVSGSGNTLTIADGGALANGDGNVGAASNSLDNAVVVTGAGSGWANNGTLQIGYLGSYVTTQEVVSGSVTNTVIATNYYTSTGNSVTVSSGGTVYAHDLVIHASNTFNLAGGGTLAIDGPFNIVQQTNLVWDAGGLLSLGGKLSGLPTTNLVADGNTNSIEFAYIDGGHDIELDGGSLPLGTTNLIVGYQASSSELIITNGGSVENADGYIGWGSAANNSVLVSGSGSTWTNSGGDLYVGAYWSGTNLVNTSGDGNSLTIENDGWVNVGDVQTNLTGGSMLVASTNGAQLVVGRGTVDVEGTLYLGLGGASGTNIIRNDGTVSVGDLLIANGSQLDLNSGGTFAIGASFDASTSGFNWKDGGLLSVGGVLSGMDTTSMVVGGATNPVFYLDGGRDLTLAGGSWDLAGTNLVVGYNDSESILTVSQSGGALTSRDAFIGWGTNSANNEVVVNEGGNWTNSRDLWVGHDGSGNTLTVSSGGSVDVGGSAYIGNDDASANNASVTGLNSILEITGDLAIGGTSNSVDNSLSVSDSGEVVVDGSLTLHSGNSIALASDGSISLQSEMNIYSNSTISGAGSIEFDAANATLAFFGNDITLGTGIVFTATSGSSNTVAVNNGMFAVDGTNALPYVNFQTLSLNNSTLNGHGLLDANTFETVSMIDGTIDPAGDGIGRLEIAGIFIPDGTTNRAQVIIDEWDELVFSGTNDVDLSTMTAEVFIPYIPVATNDIVILSATNLVGSFVETNMDVRPLLYDGHLLITNNEVQVQMVGVKDGSIASTLDFAASESIRAGFNGVKNMVFTRTKQLRRNLVSTAHAIPNEVLLLTSTNAPAGAMGPGDQNTIFDMHVWLQQYSGQGNYDRVGISDAFALNNNGTTIGADKLIGEALAVGVNYTYARSAARADNGDRLDTETYWVGAYGEWVGVDGLYVDALASYGYSSYDSERIAASYHGTASYNGHAVGVSADVGQYYYYGENLALSPYMGLHALASMTEDHNEVEDEGSVVQVDGIDHNWVESALGLKLRHRFDTPVGRFQTTGYAEWSYDFVQDEIYSSLTAADVSSTETARISPDESGINAGIGYSWICTDYMEVGVGYNGRFSDNYEEHTGSVMLDIMF